MSIILSWASFDLALVDEDEDRMNGTDVLRVSAVVVGARVVGFFECGSGDELWRRVSLAVACLKETCEIEGVEFSVSK
jgi:hypothetical protein